MRLEQTFTALHQSTSYFPSLLGARRGARAVEWDGLENRCTLTGTVGSNPTPSAKGVWDYPERLFSLGGVLLHSVNPDFQKRNLVDAAMRISRLVLVFLTACVIISPESLFGQSPVYGVDYRPPGVAYFVLKRPHFDIIYQRGREAEAAELGATLEASLPGTDSLVGVRHTLHMPVILNDFNDQSNGFVAPFPFRQEIEAVSIKGTGLSPRFSDWIETVAPHELVHAVHAEYRNGFGVVGVVRWFAPDLARSLNLTVPRGIAEGAAVLRESEIVPGAGRLNHSFFNMEYRAAMLSEHPWTLTQMLESPTYTRPFDRFYHGGSHLFAYLRDNGREDFFERANNHHNRFPFFGYSADLRYGAGMAPKELEKAFRAFARTTEQARVDALGLITKPDLIAGARGAVYRRPAWIDDSTLVVYARGYNLRAGFYRIDAETGEQSLVRTARLTEDQRFSLTKDRSSILYARYVPDPFVPSKSTSEIFRVDISSESERRLTREGHAQAPFEAPDGTIWAFCDSGQYNRLCRIKNDGPIGIDMWGKSRFVTAAGSGNLVATVLNVRGNQGVFLSNSLSADNVELAALISFRDGSIYDVSWSADGRYLAFTADPGGIPNIFVYDRSADRVCRLTNMAFGAMDPSLSPDGQTLAFVSYQHERYDLVRMPFRPDMARKIPRDSTKFMAGLPWREWLRPDDSPSVDGDVGRPYRSFRYLAPRMVYPTIRYEDQTTRGGDVRLGLGLGVGIQGADPLRRWSYAGELFRQKNELWGNLWLQTGIRVFRPYLRLYRQPETVVARTFNIEGRLAGGRRFGLEERGVEAGAYVPITIEDNVYRTTAAVSVRTRYRQERLFGEHRRRLTPFVNRLTLNPAAVLGWRLQSNPRDLIPSSGIAVGVSGEVDVSARGRSAVRRRALVSQINGYLPLFRSHNIGLRLNMGLLTQNRGSIFNLDRFVPRGYENEFIDRGTYVRYGAEYIQPIAYIDNGPFTVPLYFKAIYAFAYASTFGKISGAGRRFSSVGGGLGIKMRFFYLINVDLRITPAYLVERRKWDLVFR